MFINKQYNPIIFSGIIIVFIMFNMYVHKNYAFGFLCAVVIAIFLYQNLHNEKTLYSKDKKLEKILKQIRLDEISLSEHVSLRVPSQFRYIRLTQELTTPIIKLNFLNRYYEESFVRIVAILEHFLKKYYNIITNKISPSNKENMKDLYEVIVSTENEIYFNIPKYDRRSNKNYHIIVQQEIKRIRNIMKNKLRLVLSL